MDKITDYDLATGNTVEELAKRVKNMIKKGWEPLGSPLFIATAFSGPSLVQAMVIYKRGGPA